MTMATPLHSYTSVSPKTGPPTLVSPNHGLYHVPLNHTRVARRPWPPTYYPDSCFRMQPTQEHRDVRKSV